MFTAGDSNVKGLAALVSPLVGAQSAQRGVADGGRCGWRMSQCSEVSPARGQGFVVVQSRIQGCCQISRDPMVEVRMQLVPT